MVAPRGGVWLLPGGAFMVAPRGTVCGCSGGGHAWFFPGGMRGFSQGHAWFFLGGMHGFCQGGVHRIRRDTVNEQAVRILLECILVCGNVLCGLNLPNKKRFFNPAG